MLLGTFTYFVTHLIITSNKLWPITIVTFKSHSRHVRLVKTARTCIVLVFGLYMHIWHSHLPPCPKFIRATQYLIYKCGLTELCVQAKSIGKQTLIWQRGMFDCNLLCWKPAASTSGAPRSSNENFGTHSQNVRKIALFRFYFIVFLLSLSSYQLEKIFGNIINSNLFRLNVSQMWYLMEKSTLF